VAGQATVVAVVDFQEFLRRARETHGERYDYSQSETHYTTFKGDKIPIVCQEHGVFEQRPSNHAYRGQGCPMCAGVALVDFQEFLHRARETHGERYDYSQSETHYTTFKGDKIPIVCQEHGVFEIGPSNHVSRKQGCQVCWLESRNSSLDFTKLGSTSSIEWKSLITSDEGPLLEFKAGIFQGYDAVNGEIIPGGLFEDGFGTLVKEVAAFLNSDGGILIVGIWEDPRDPSNKLLHGIEPDIVMKKATEESYTKKIVEGLNSGLLIGSICDTHVKLEIFDYEGKKFLGLVIKSLTPDVTFIKGSPDLIYIREAAGKKDISGQRMIKYCIARQSPEP
jgi:hypothetical protein